MENVPRQDGKDVLLRVDNLGVVFETDAGELMAAGNVSFDIRRGEVVGLVGESGCGKSVTAQSILRLIPSPPGRIVSGRIVFDGEDLRKLPAHSLRAIRGQRISMIFQEPMTALSPLHRIGRQLVEAQRIHQNISRRDAWKNGEFWLNRVGIPDAAARMFCYPFELSGGMRQRVMIAMALMLHPDLIIADEPTTALDVTIQAQILDLMLEMKEQDTSLLLITHDMGVIWEVCDTVNVMYTSRIVERGSVRQVYENPLHPYTKALLTSMPALAGTADRLPAIKGQVPSLLKLPDGCNFADRCPYVLERCRREEPDLFRFADNRRSACFVSERWAAKKETAGLTDEPSQEKLRAQE